MFLCFLQSSLILQLVLRGVEWSQTIGVVVCMRIDKLSALELAYSLVAKHFCILILTFLFVLQTLLVMTTGQGVLCLIRLIVISSTIVLTVIQLSPVFCCFNAV